MGATVRPHQFDPVIMIRDFAARRKAHSGAPRGRAKGLILWRGKRATPAAHDASCREGSGHPRDGGRAVFWTEGARRAQR
jgi:hypothetical protein